MIHKITLKDKFLAQNHHDTFISRKEKVDIHEQIPTNSIYHRLGDRFIEKYVEEKSTNLMCIFDDITSFDDNYVLKIQTNFT